MKNLLTLVFCIFCFTSSFSQTKNEISINQKFFSNDYFEGGKEITKTKFQFLLKSDPLSKVYLRKYKINTAWAWIFASGSILTSIGALVLNTNDDPTDDVNTLLEQVFWIGGCAIFSVRANRMLKRSIKTYNENLETTGYINFGLQKNGIGFSYVF